MISEKTTAPYIKVQQMTQQHLIEASGPYSNRTEEFSFVELCVGLEVIDTAGTVIGYEGKQVEQTSYDNCVLIMPSLRQLPWNSAVRFGKYT